MGVGGLRWCLLGFITGMVEQQLRDSSGKCVLKLLDSNPHLAAEAMRNGFLSVGAADGVGFIGGP